jgi:DNA-binding response OmpR family regulator
MINGELDKIAAHLNLSRSERAIFGELLMRKNQLVARQDLLGLLRARSPHTIDSHIMMIRRKLSQNRSALRLETVRKSGFILYA